MAGYVHGYSEKEADRLEDQSNTLDELLHFDSVWKAGDFILEAGCGTGAQTKIIAGKNPLCKFISVDISAESIRKAGAASAEYGITNVSFKQADIFNLPFDEGYFDHIFICFVLEHLHDCKTALMRLKKLLKPNGTITVIEGDHGSAYFYPESREANAAIQCQVELQKRDGGDANIGRRLFPLLNEAGFENVTVSPRMVYVDESRPGLVEGFTRNTFTAMIEGIKSKAIAEKLTDEKTFDKGINDLYRTAGSGGVFCYTFFKATGIIK